MFVRPHVARDRMEQQPCWLTQVEHVCPAAQLHYTTILPLKHVKTVFQTSLMGANFST